MLALSVADCDPDYVLYELSADDGAFRGTVRLYGDDKLPLRFADGLAGFPKNPRDTRVVTLGAFGPRTAGGAARFTLRCTDRAGHFVLEAELEDAPDGTGSSPRTSAVRFSLESSRVDVFVSQLRALPIQPGARVEVGGTAR